MFYYVFCQHENVILFGWQKHLLLCFKLTRCLSICKCLKFGSNSKRCGSKLTGDCRRPLLHSDHSGLMSPQNDGPTKNYQNFIRKKRCVLLFLSFFAFWELYDIRWFWRQAVDHTDLEKVLYILSQHSKI